MKMLYKLTAQLTALALLMLTAVTTYAQPANDLCANATTVVCGQTVTGNTDAATLDSPPACGLTFPRYGVWYKFLGTGQMVTLSTCSATTNYDTQIGVYSGSCTSLVCVAGNNNDAACASNGRNSTVTFSSTGGVTYFIWVTGVLSSRGNFSLSVTCTGATSGCTCVHTSQFPSAAVTAPTTPTVTTITSCNFGGEYARITGAVAGATYTFTSSVATDYLTIRQGTSSGTPLGCGVTPVTVTATASGDLYMHVSTNSACGTASSCRTTTIQCSSCSAPPPTNNNECSGAVTLTPAASCAPVNGNNIGATQSLAAITCDGFTSSSALDVWYKFVATGSTHTVIATGGTTLDIIVDVRSGACNGSSIGCSDDQILSGNPEIVALTGLSAGTTYLIRVYGWAGATGNFTICVTNGSTTLAEYNNDGPASVISPRNNFNQPVVGDIYPNPTKIDQAFVDIATPNEGLANIQLFDQTGRRVQNIKVDLIGGENKVTLDVSNLAQGTYFASVVINNEIFRKKLVVIR